jgi:hypothetical protein
MPKVFYIVYKQNSTSNQITSGFISCIRHTLIDRKLFSAVGLDCLIKTAMTMG